MPEFEPTIVVAGALVENGRLLLARRASPPELAGLWELPGGKVDPGETPEDALVRELREELDIEVTVDGVIGADVPLENGALLRAFAVTRFSGTVTAVEHEAVRWVDLGELHRVELVPADRAWMPELAILL
ncbi:MAG: (deoxy)nucleoside triphosphate pyrophosphohydrolase [Rhodococcus sp. (in: high G+C Gram-positive bacteria)]